MKEEREPADGPNGRLGQRVHTFNTKARTSNRPTRAIEVSGIGGAALVPVGLAAIEGTVGMVVAIFGAGVAIVAYFLSARKKKNGTSTQIEVFRNGIVCSQGSATRTIVWNEIIDISCKKVTMSDDIPAMALVFETVNDQPLLIVVGGHFSNQSETAKLLDNLRDVWIPVWCRRARVLGQQLDGLRIGRAVACCEYLAIDGRKLPWSAIKGIDVVNGVEQLETAAGTLQVEDGNLVTPFPSVAQRLAALAHRPPSAPMLPPPMLAQPNTSSGDSQKT